MLEILLFDRGVRAAITKTAALSKRSIRAAPELARSHKEGWIRCADAEASAYCQLACFTLCR